MRKSLFLLLGLFFCGCGGGGGGFLDVAGVWWGNATTLEDTCPYFTESYIYFKHLVNQDDTAVVVDNGAMAFTGTPEERGAIVASATRPSARQLNGITNCQEEITWRYEAIEEDYSDFVVRRSVVTCTDGNLVAQCQVVHTGFAHRSRSPGGPAPYPIDTEVQGAVSDTTL